MRELKARSHLAVWLCLSLLVTLQPLAHAAPVMAVDYGSDALKVSVVKAGRPPINIVINELSKRRTSAEVGLPSPHACPCACHTTVLACGIESLQSSQFDEVTFRKFFCPRQTMSERNITLSCTMPCAMQLHENAMSGFLGLMRQSKALLRIDSNPVSARMRI